MNLLLALFFAASAVSQQPPPVKPLITGLTPQQYDLLLASGEFYFVWINNTFERVEWENKLEDRAEIESKRDGRATIRMDKRVWRSDEDVLAFLFEQARCMAEDNNLQTPCNRSKADNLVAEFRRDLLDARKAISPIHDPVQQVRDRLKDAEASAQTDSAAAKQFILEGVKLLARLQSSGTVAEAQALPLRSSFARLNERLQQTDVYFEKASEYANDKELDKALDTIRKMPENLLGMQPRFRTLGDEVRSKQDQANRLLRQGQADLQRGDKKASLKALERARDLSRDPQILQWIARAKQFKKQNGR